MKARGIGLWRRLGLVVAAVGMLADAAVAYEGLDPTIEQLFEYQGSRKIGGIYEGRARPLYIDEDLYVQLLDYKVSGERPACASRDLALLSGQSASAAFRNKFEMLLRVWLAGRTVVLVGSGACSNQAEHIIAVIPQ